MTTSRLLIVVIVVVVVLAIASAIVGARSHHPRPAGQSRSDQAAGMRQSGQGGSFAVFDRLAASARRPFDLAQITIAGRHPASRQLTMPAKGSTTLVVGKGGDGVRQLSLVLISPAGQAQLAISYAAPGPLPAGVGQDDLPGRGDGPKPALPDQHAGKGGDPSRCDLPIYPCGASITVTSGSAQPCTIEIR
jgi:hypothetical protein